MWLLIIVGLMEMSVPADAIDNPQKVVGPERCIMCHKMEGTGWQKTHHFLTFEEMHKRPEAKAIAEKMGVKRIKSEATCMKCHYTQNAEGEAIAGISCESCHGAAKDWIKIHNDFGGAGATRATETPEHRTSRISKAAAGGMLRPGNIYDVARNCFQCHTVPNEKLVEVGGHKVGSDFELVSWSQGEIRHNYVRTGSASNAEITPAIARVMYVAGRLLDLEYGLRGVAEVTKTSPYAVEMAKRTKRALGYLDQITKVVAVPELNQILDIGSKAKLKANNKEELIAAANAISKASQTYLARADGAQLEAVDKFIPTARKGKSTP